MSQRIVLSLTAITVLLIIFIGGLLVWGTQGAVEDGFRVAPQPAWADRMASRLDNVRLIRIERKGEEITLRRHKGIWRLSQLHGYPIHTNAATTLLNNLANIEGHFVSEEPIPHARYGVANAPGSSVGTGTELELLDGEGLVLENLVVGQIINVPADDGVMEVQAMRRAAEGRIWLFTPVVQLSLWQANWVDTTIVRVPSSEVTKLSAVSRDNHREKWVLKRETSNEIISTGPQGDTRLSVRQSLEAERMMGSFANLRFDDVREISPEETAESWQWKTSVETVEGIVYDVRLWDEDGINWISITAHAAGRIDEEATAKIADFNERHSGWGYQLSPVLSKNLIIERQDFVEER